MAKAFSKPEALSDNHTHYCPGCTHGIIHRLVAEALDELGIREKTVGVAPVGCAVLAYNYFDCDFQEAAHGRAPAMATGIKRARPDLTVFTYQGDGDLASIGLSEIMHAANRGEKFTTIFVNNAIYGMTGGQMAPTTLVGQRATTCPDGRCAEEHGQPIRMSEIIGGLGGTAYCERVSLDSVKNIRRAKKALRKAFEMQVNGTGFGFVEMLSACPTNWGMDAVSANTRIAEEMIPYFPLGVFKDVTKDGEE